MPTMSVLYFTLPTLKTLCHLHAYIVTYIILVGIFNPPFYLYYEFIVNIIDMHNII